MGKKITKREKKFKKKGGIHSALEKGTVTKKGRVPRSKSSSSKRKNDATANNKTKKLSQQQDYNGNKKQRETDDFLSVEHVKDLDMDAFLGKITESIEQQNQKQQEKHDADEDASVSSSSSDKEMDSASEGTDEESSEEEGEGEKHAVKGPTKTQKDAKAKETKKSKNESKRPSKNESKKIAKKENEEDSESSNSSSSHDQDGDKDSDDGEDDEDVKRAEARMKAQMKKMQQDDPEFHEFLKKNEKSLLEFGQYDDDDDDDDDDEAPEDMEESDNDEDDDDDEGKKTKKSKQKSSDIVLTTSLLKEFEKGAFDRHSIKHWKKLITAYRSACFMADEAEKKSEKKHRRSAGDEDDDDEEGQDDDDHKGRSKMSVGNTKYIIDSSEVFDKLMVLCLNRCHEELHYHLLGAGSTGQAPSKKKKQDGKGKSKTKEDEDEESKLDEEELPDDNKPIAPKKLESALHWAKMQFSIKLFFKSTNHVLMESKEPELLTFVLKALSKYIPYATPFPHLAEQLLKTCNALWSAPLDSSEDYHTVRLQAFFRIRQLALTQPYPFIEHVLKKTYLSYAKRAKFGTGASAVHTVLPTLTFMGNCLVELYSLDYHSAYQHAFVYIRQLALHLRTAMQKKTPEAFQQVYCWQYLHCLKLWVAVLAHAAPADDSTLMRSLIYPVTEIITGVVRMAPSPVRHLPLRFHCVRLLQQLAASAEVFIPTTAILLDCLDFKEVYQPPMKEKKSGKATRGLQLRHMFKLAKDDPLRTHEQLDACLSELFVLLQREIELYRFSAGFPEFSIRITQRLRQFAKETRNARWRTFARGCMETCERYAAAAVEARSKLKEAPKDIVRLECLRQPFEPSMRERHEASVEKEAKAQDATRAAPNLKKRKTDNATEEKKGDDKEEEEDSDDDDDEDDASPSKEANPSKRKKVTKEQETKPKNKSKATMSDLDHLQDDQVEEGVNWSDSDEGSDAEQEEASSSGNSDSDEEE